MLIHREMRNRGNLTREFDTGDIVVVHKQVKSIRKEGISKRLVFKAKVTYKILEKATTSLYWLQHLPFSGSLGRPRIKAKESEASM